MYELQILTAGELAFLAERAEIYSEVSSPGIRMWGAGLLYEVHAEQRRRDRDLALTRARFDAIAAELRTKPDDLIGDTHGLPPWSQASG